MIAPRTKYALVAAGLALSFAAGRFAAPTKVEERFVVEEKVVERIDEKLVAELREELRVAREQITTLSANTHRETRTTIEPSGRVEVVQIEDTATAIASRETETREVVRTATVVEERIVEREVVRKIEVEKIVERDPPRWRISAIAGVSVPDLTDPLSAPLAVGAAVQYRVVGPISIGAWGLSSGQGGASIAVDLW